MFSARIVSGAFCLVVLALLFMGPPNVAIAVEAPTSSYEKTFSNKSATGEELANAFFDLLSNTGSPAGNVGTTAEQDEASKVLVKPYLDRAFQLQRASGERYTAENYLPADVEEFEVGDVRETRPAKDVVVVRYSVRATQTLPDAALLLSKDKAPRLTVFHWSHPDSRWKIISHANFNTPVAAMCNRKPMVESKLASYASAEDQALGARLTNEWMELLEKGSFLPMLSPMFQFQTASGKGMTGISEFVPGRVSKREVKDLVITRNDNLLVVTLYAMEPNSEVLGEQVGEKFAPRIYTFFKYKDGSWRMISCGYFNVPTHLPEDVACVPAGKLENAP